MQTFCKKITDCSPDCPFIHQRSFLGSGTKRLQRAVGFRYGKPRHRCAATNNTCESSIQCRPVQTTRSQT